MGRSYLAERFSHHVRLSEAEAAALRTLEDSPRRAARGAALIRESDSLRELFVLADGWAHSSRMLGDGGRQITAFHFPGDLLGLPLLAFAEAPETVTAVTDVTLCPIQRERLADLIADHPRLGALFLAQAVAASVAVSDRLASIGRHSAKTRVASLLCEIHSRLSMLGLVEEGALHLPLTQEEIGDATGLTAVHVNRMMRLLAEDGLIERRGSRLHVLDHPRLCAAGGFTDRTRIDSGWLPASR